MSASLTGQADRPTGTVSLGLILCRWGIISPVEPEIRCNPKLSKATGKYPPLAEWVSPARL